MKIIKDYIEYLKDNPEDYWFKRKPFGWGWTPAKAEGWMVMLIYILAVLFFALTLDENSSSKEIMFTFIIPLILLTFTLIRICYKKGEKPRWEWGFPKKHRKSKKRKIK